MSAGGTSSNGVPGRRLASSSARSRRGPLSPDLCTILGPLSMTSVGAGGTSTGAGPCRWVGDVGVLAVRSPAPQRPTGVRESTVSSLVVGVELSPAGSVPEDVMDPVLAPPLTGASDGSLLLEWAPVEVVTPLQDCIRTWTLRSFVSNCAVSRRSPDSSVIPIRDGSGSSRLCTGFFDRCIGTSHR